MVFLSAWRHPTGHTSKSPARCSARYPARSSARCPVRCPARYPALYLIRYPMRCPARCQGRSPARCPARRPARHPARHPERRPERCPSYACCDAHRYARRDTQFFGELIKANSPIKWCERDQQFRAGIAWWCHGRICWRRCRGQDKEHHAALLRG